MGNTRKRACADAEPAPLTRTRDFLAARILPGERLCLGLSGGLDSSVLLRILADLRVELGYELGAVHVHHGLSINADTWAEACRRACDALDVPLRIERVSVAPSGHGVEAAARAARYAAYARQGTDHMVLAHHLDDQIETFFLRLLRGSGVRGLSAMAESARWHGMPILRPLLHTRRAELEACVRAWGLDHVEDESNLDTRLTRNYLRQDWLPRIEARFPAYRETLWRDIAHLREAESLLEDLAQLDVARLDDPEHPSILELARLGPARAKNVLRHWLRGKSGLTPDSAQLDMLWTQFISARADAEPVWRVGAVEVHRHRGRFHLADASAPPPAAQDWQGEPRVGWGQLGEVVFEPVEGRGLARRHCDGRVCEIGARQGGERLRPDRRRPARTVKDWLREAGVPHWERATLPMLRIDGDLAWVAGLGLDCRYEAQPGEPGWLISWQPRP
jgi:tRNA(Ile)-lysidine synthase